MSFHKAIYLIIAVPLICGAVNDDLYRGSVKFVRGSFVIENFTDWTWLHCTLKINPDDKKDFTLEYVEIPPGPTAFQATRFSQEYPSEKYNPNRYPPMIMRLICGNPRATYDGARAAREFTIK